MSPAELATGIAAYLLSSLSLGLVSWMLAEMTLPATARIGLRLSAIIAGQMAICSILVQTLGIFGLLQVSWYLAFSLASGIAVLFFWRAKRPLQAAFRLVQRVCRLWLVAPAWGLGWLGALCLLYLAKRCLFLPRDIDALTLHGPMIAEWIGAGRIALSSYWNYPQCWEYQFVPAFLLLRSDVLVAIPSLLAAVAIALAVRELATRLALGGRIGHLLALLVATMPVVWRETLKNDAIFAFALLLGILAVDRAARRLPGSFWLFQLAAFLIFGTKPSGFLYVGLLAVAYLAAYRIAAERQKAQRRSGELLVGLAFFLLFQASALAVQLKNFFVNGNPVHPLRLELFGLTIFDGTGDLAGTSILDNLGQAEVWRQLKQGGDWGVGAESVLLPPLLLAALISALAAALRRVSGRQAPKTGATLAWLLPPAAALLWILFLATPWSAGPSRGNWQYLGSGESLRYAIAPLALTCLVAAEWAQRLLGRRNLVPLLALLFPLLVYEKWDHRKLFADGRLFLWSLFAVWLLVAGLDRGLGRRLARIGLGMKIVASFVLVLALTAWFAGWVEGIRERRWVKPFRAVWTEVHRQIPPGSTIGTNDPSAGYRYFLYGPRFENRIAVVDIGAGDGGKIPEEIDYFYLYARQGEEDRRQLIEALGRSGWRVLALPEDGRAALLAGPRIPVERVAPDIGPEVGAQ